MIRFNKEDAAHIWLTSDWHFGHNRNFIYEPRGFSSIEEMNKTIIDKYNSKVAPNDIVFCLGDCMLGDNDKGIECIKQLNGKIYILPGNHDTSNRLRLYSTIPNVIILSLAELIKIGKRPYYLSHYPTMTGNFDVPYINFYGHTHQKTNFYDDMPFAYHVGVDSHDCYPVNFNEAIEDIRKKI